MAIISENIVKLLNYRINQEELSSRIYKAMSVWLNYSGYTGASKLWDKYSSEELVHSEKVYNYLLDLDIKPNVDSIEKPSIQESFVGIIKQSYEHEIKITEQCKKLAQECQKEGDYMTLELAQWFLKEQVEEIGKTCGWLDKLDAFGTEKDVLRMLDNEMGLI